MIQLRGITWNHTRGFTPLVACAQRFSELHPEVDITWTRRSLLEFGETPVEELANRFDLLVIDHPFIGYAARKEIFRPLEEILLADTVADWAQTTVGASGASYCYAGKTWAAPIDAACPVALWRPDLLDRLRVEPPRNWAGLLRLAARGGVLIPGMHTDAIHHFYMLCLALGAEPGAEEEEFVSETISTQALGELAQLYGMVPEACQRMNPIAVHEALASGDGPGAYCPFAFGYSNYSRRGYVAHRLQAGVPPHWREAPMRTTLGGTGLAVARGCKMPEWAGKFAAFAASREVQRGLYWQAGGQPAHRDAWIDPVNNAESNRYLSATLPAVEAAWVRPRFPGYLHFQDHAAPVIHAAVCGRQSISTAVEQLNRLWREARRLRLSHEN